jgi:hypothetical protein
MLHQQEPMNKEVEYASMYNASSVPKNDRMYPIFLLYEQVE